MAKNAAADKLALQVAEVLTDELDFSLYDGDDLAMLQGRMEAALSGLMEMRKLRQLLRECGGLPNAVELLHRHGLLPDVSSEVSAIEKAIDSDLYGDYSDATVSGADEALQGLLSVLEGWKSQHEQACEAEPSSTRKPMPGP